MQQFRTLPDGSIQFPARGNPPVSVEGYEQDPGDKYLFHPDFVECKHRELHLFTKPCGKRGCKWICKHYKKEVKPRDCEACKLEPKT